MIKLIWSILCSNSSVDQQTNNLSLFGTLEQIAFTVNGPDMQKAREVADREHIVAPFNFQVISLVSRESPADGSESELKIGIIDPSGKTLNSFDQPFVFEEGKNRMRLIVNMTGLPVNKSGRYMILVMLKDIKTNKYNTVAELPLEVSVNFA